MCLSRDGAREEGEEVCEDGGVQGGERRSEVVDEFLEEALNVTM